MEPQGQGPYLVQGHITWAKQESGWSLETWPLRSWTPDSLEGEIRSELCSASGSLPMLPRNEMGRWKIGGRRLRTA